MYSRPTEATIAFIEKKFAGKPDIATANVTAFRAGFNFGETTEAFAVHYEVKPAAADDRHLPQHQRQSRPLVRTARSIAAVEAAAVPRRVPDHAGLGHPARIVQVQAFRCTYFPGRGRDRRHRRRPRRRVRRRACRHHQQRPGHRAQGRDHRPRGEPGAATGHLRHPAWRAVHRTADQDRTVRPAPGDVRTQWRGAGADRRGAVPRRLLLRRARGCTYRAHLPHAGVPALRRLPRERVRAMAGPRARRSPRPRGGVRDRAERHGVQWRRSR